METRILLLKPSSLGDVVQALQVITALKRQKPETHITWVIRDIFADLLMACPVIDELIIFQRSLGLRGLWQCLRTIRKKPPFDLVWDMQGLLRTGLMTLAAKSSLKIGRQDAREFSGLFYSERVPLPKRKPPHAIEILEEFLPTIGAERAADYLHLERLSDLLPDLKGRPYVLIFPESRGPRKEWKYFSELFQRLCQQHPDLLFLCCGQRNEPDFSPLAAMPNFLDLRKKTSLSQILFLVQQSEGVIGNDSGCIHLAAAIGKPTLAFYVCTDPRRYGPYPVDEQAREQIFILENPDPNFPKLDDFMACVKKHLTC